MKLMLHALTKFCLGIFLVGILLFLPAGTVCYPGGIAFLCLLSAPILILGIMMWLKNPRLLEKRLDVKEKDPMQKGAVALAGLVFLGGFVLAGLDFRFGWSVVPTAVSVAASLLFLLSYALYAMVVKENAYLSRTVGVEEGQKVVDTGLYAIVRHPMYTATILMFLVIPLILGSWYSFGVFLFYPFIIARRIRGEELLLSKHLPGYDDYRKKVKYKLIPFLW